MLVRGHRIQRYPKRSAAALDQFPLETLRLPFSIARPVIVGARYNCGAGLLSAAAPIVTIEKKIIVAVAVRGNAIRFTLAWIGPPTDPARSLL